MTATPPAGRANHMGISLIVTKSIDREYNETGDAILKQEWMVAPIILPPPNTARPQRFAIHGEYAVASEGVGSNKAV